MPVCLDLHLLGGIAACMGWRHTRSHLGGLGADGRGLVPPGRSWRPEATGKEEWRLAKIATNYLI